MKKIKLLTFLLLVTISFWSCQNSQSVEVENDATPTTLNKSATLDKAELSLYVLESGNGFTTNLGEQVNVHMLTRDWIAADVTWKWSYYTTSQNLELWTTPGGDYTDLSTVPYFIPDAVNSYVTPAADITEIVKLNKQRA